MNDEKILELFIARDEQAISATACKYGNYCHTIADRVLQDRQDAEEVVNETWLRAWNTIPPQRPVLLKMYLAKITRNLAFSRYRSRSAAKRGGNGVDVALEELQECISSSVSPESHIEGLELQQAIRCFLDTLPQREQHIFIRRYFFVDEMREIARRYGLTEAHVRKILSRTRQKLKEYLNQEGFTV